MLDNINLDIEKINTRNINKITNAIISFIICANTLINKKN
jgi:hypothetical protein